MSGDVYGVVFMPVYVTWRVTCHGVPAGASLAIRRDTSAASSQRQESPMPVIKPRTRGKQFVRHTTRLDRENNETLYAHAHFISESAEYVLNQLVESVLGKDKEFLAWRAPRHDSATRGCAAGAAVGVTMGSDGRPRAGYSRRSSMMLE
jgi:hypothetical protein